MDVWRERRQVQSIEAYVVNDLMKYWTWSYKKHDFKDVIWVLDCLGNVFTINILYIKLVKAPIYSTNALVGMYPAESLSFSLHALLMLFQSIEPQQRVDRPKKDELELPKHSMYAIYAHIDPQNHPN